MTIEVYNGVEGLMIWYRNPEYGGEWPSMSYMLIVERS